MGDIAEESYSNKEAGALINDVTLPSEPPKVVKITVQKSPYKNRILDPTTVRLVRELESKQGSV